jgi:5-methyltetrahydrofolate--homocysteine methyltransferase
MPRVVTTPDQFTIIGENIHASRVVLRNGRRAKSLEDGTEAVPFRGETGDQRFLTVPEWFRSTQPYEQGQIKHFMIAMRKGISEDHEEQEEGRAYVHYETRRQAKAGARYLDLNVDEISPYLDMQKQAMKWVVETVQEVSPLPPSVDSSNAEIIAEGLAAYDGRAGRPMVNSLALERLQTLDLVIEHNATVIVTAAGQSGMPQDDDERIENVGTLLEFVQSKEVPLSDVYIDPLVFLISVDPRFGNHYFDAVKAIRKTYGSEVHVTGGLSNVSFGLPNRKLINDTFISLALDAGIDGGIIDPIQSKLESAFELDTDSEPVRLAMDMLLGKDDFCMNYIQAYRDGRLG